MYDYKSPIGDSKENNCLKRPEKNKNKAKIKKKMNQNSKRQQKVVVLAKKLQNRTKTPHGVPPNTQKPNKQLKNTTNIDTAKMINFIVYQAKRK